MKAVQLQSTGGVDVINSERCAAAAIEQHQRTPVLLGVSALHLTKKFHRLARHMLVLNTHRAVAVIALVPQLFDVPPAEHVAIHEQRPAQVSHQMRYEEAGEG